MVKNFSRQTKLSLFNVILSFLACLFYLNISDGIYIFRLLNCVFLLICYIILSISNIKKLDSQVLSVVIFSLCFFAEICYLMQLQFDYSSRFLYFSEYVAIALSSIILLFVIFKKLNAAKHLAVLKMIFKFVRGLIYMGSVFKENISYSATDILVLIIGTILLLVYVILYELPFVYYLDEKAV